MIQTTTLPLAGARSSPGRGVSVSGRQVVEASDINDVALINYIEKAFQKQQGIFQNAKATGKKVAKNQRWYKDVGLGFKTPKEAIEGHYIDKKCPFTGDVSIRGRILTGEVISTKMKRTIIVRREYLHYIPKYHRYEKRHKNLAAHLSPCFIGVQQGDSVTVGQCRPLSKTVRFNVLKVQKKVVKGAKNFAKF
ncbi:30S ribosomal protein S11, chloroplastic [Actinomortierella ambigua]|nr:30S ribosomal protein S11, chloroplastic [Actinomortierella ambigua]